MTVRGTILFFALLTLSACVTFEHAPVAKLSCDPALAGQWRALKNGPPDRIIVVSADCTLHWPEENGGTYTTKLESFALDESRYLVFTPTVADRLMSAEGDILRNAPKDSVFLARYRVDSDRTLVWLADPDEAMRPVAKGQATGARRNDADVHVKGSRSAIAKLLRARGNTLFAGKQDGRGTMQLQRITPAATP